MRKSTDKVVKLRELRESVPDSERVTLLSGLNREVFDTFGTNIDQSGEDRLANLKHKSDEMKQRQV